MTTFRPARRNMTVHLKELVISLFECATSTTEEDIRAKVRDSFLTIGQSQPAVFLEASHAYLVQNSRLTTPNRAYVLDSIAAVLDAPGVVSRIDEQEALLTINLAIQETLMSKDDELAEAGRNILTVLSKHVKLVNHVLDGLLQKFPPGVSTPPNKYVPQTLGAIALTNARGFVPFLTDILCRTVPLLSHIKPEPLRSIWSRALSAFVDALVEYQSAASNDDSTQSHGAGLIHVSEQLQRDYCDQMELILDVVMNWISAKDPKTRADAFECVGSLLLLASNARVLKELKKVVTTFLNMYKKGSLDDQFSMTKGMFFFLVRACSDDNVPVEPYLDDICNCLFVHVTVQNEQIDDTTRSTISPITMRLRNEVCRCFLAASQRFGDKLVYYLLHKMQSVQDSVKLGAIDLIRHLLNASECNMEDKRSLIVMGLKPLLTDDTLSVRVKSSMCQLCVALADHGYVHIDSGGANVIHFLTTNLVAEHDPVSKKNLTPPSATELTQLRNQSAQALCTIANTCDSAHQLLWPQLLELICAENYNTVATDVFKVLRILVQKMEQLGNKVSFDFSAETHPRAAGPHQVLVRLMTCMNIAPLSSALTVRAREAVKLLKVLGEAIQPSIGPIISKELPSLLHTLDGTTTPVEALSPVRSSARRMTSPEPPSPHDVKKAKVERFQASVLGLLKELTSISASKEWLEALASAQGKQLSLYTNAPHDKAFLATCLGFTLARLTDEKFVKDHIVLAFRTINHSSAVERRGMASAVGQCARQHTALMLTELENVTKWEHSKRGSSGLLGFIKDAYHRGTDAGAIFLRATVVLSYGFLVTICPTDFLPQRLDQTVLPFLRQYMIESKNDVVVREAHLETIHMIAQAVERLTSDYKLEARYEMLSYVKEYVNQENPEMLSTWVRLLACRASTSLVRLEPPLSDNELWDLASVLSKFVLTICREKPGLKTINDDETSTTMDATVNEYRQAIAQMVVKRPVVETVCQMLKIFSPYFGSNFDYERLRSIEVTVLVLKLYFKNATDYTIGHASDFSPLSMLLARLSPRIVDSLHAVRQSAIHAVWLSFQLSFLHKGQMTNSGHDLDLSDEPALFDLNNFRESYLAFDGKLDSMKGRAAIAALAKEIESHLPQSQLQTYLSALFKMLNDKQNNVSSAAAQLLSVILHDRGQLLHEEAEIIVATILENLPTVHPVIQTYTDLLNALTFFADHQLQIVVEVLLRQAVPHSNSVADAWKMLVAQHSQFSPADQVLEVPVCVADEGTGHFEIVDLSGGCVVKLVNPALVGQMAALAEMIKFGEPDEVIISRTPKLLALLLHNLVAVMEAQYPGAVPVAPVQAATLTNGKPKRKECTIITAELKRVSASPAALVTETLRTLLERLHAENVIEAMNHERAWTHLTKLDDYIDAIFVMTNALCEFYPAHMRAWIEASFGGHAHTCEFYRIANAALLSSLITRCPKAESGEFDDALLDSIVAELKQLIMDKSLLVRKLTIRAYTAIGKLAKSASNGEAIAQKYARIAFEAGLNGLDDAYDRKDEIASESIYALDSVVAVVDVDFVAERLSSLLLKLRPCFEKESAALRAVAFRLYGQLGSIVGEASEFKQSIHENIVSILLHLNDKDSEVSQNCAKVLIQTAPLLSLDTFSTLVDDTLFDGKPPSAYPNFLKDVGQILAVSYPDRLNAYALGCSNYYKSQFADIRSNAALFTGFLLEPLSPALRGTLSKELIFTSLVALLRDPSSKVRLSTIRAISCLHEFA
uniref:Condensin complex subunit 1 n=1 Tax=Panagrellus redivivus TaxID=6233 RepID=A0A7E4WD25_PANRE